MGGPLLQKSSFEQELKLIQLRLREEPRFLSKEKVINENIQRLKGNG